jgi:hypothetical protein
MKLRTRTLFLCFALVACEGGIGGKPSKMSSGELYESGESKYDGYFKKVHDEQVAAANWADESKTARKSLTTALNLPPNASSSAILSAAKEAKEKGKKTDAIQSAAEETAALEKAFAEKQRANAERLDKLSVEGVELKKQATEDHHNMGAEKADPAKVDKKEEIKREVAASVDVAANLRDDAKKGVSDIERLVDGLKKELGIVGDGVGIVKKDEPTAKNDDGKKSDGKKDGSKKSDGKKDEGKKAEAKPTAKKPDPKPATDAKPEDKPAAPKPAPAQKPAETEVFNP